MRVPGRQQRIAAAVMHAAVPSFAFSMADAHPDGSRWLHSPSASPQDVTPTEDTTIENSDGDHSMDDHDSGSVDGEPTPNKIACISSSGVSSSSVPILPLQVVSSSGVSSSSGLAILPLQEGSVLAKSQYSCMNLIKIGSAKAKGVWVYVQELTDKDLLKKKNSQGQYPTHVCIICWRWLFVGSTVNVMVARTAKKHFVTTNALIHIREHHPTLVEAIASSDAANSKTLSVSASMLLVGQPSVAAIFSIPLASIALAKSARFYGLNPLAKRLQTNVCAFQLFYLICNNFPHITHMISLWSRLRFEKDV